MNSSDLPAIYNSADSGSNAAQSNYLWIIRIEYALLSLAALLSAFRSHEPWAFWILAFLIVALFGLLIFRYVSRLDRQWYGCRALAESIKTNAWKFAMRAHPFEDAENLGVLVRKFLNIIIEMRKTNEFIGVSLDAKFSDKDQITKKMRELHSDNWQKRLEYYIEHRVRSQRTWYAKKADWNVRRRRFWFLFAIFVYLIAALALFSSQSDTWDISWSFDALLVVVTSSFGWIQVKRHGELAASYTLTAHEIGSIQGLSDEVESEESLSEFVTKAEFAFSREHTQWAARRDFS